MASAGDICFENSFVIDTVGKKKKRKSHGKGKSYNTRASRSAGHSDAATTDTVEHDSSATSENLGFYIDETGGDGSQGESLDDVEVRSGSGDERSDDDGHCDDTATHDDEDDDDDDDDDDELRRAADVKFNGVPLFPPPSSCRELPPSSLDTLEPYIDLTAYRQAVSHKWRHKKPETTEKTTHKTSSIQNQSARDPDHLMKHKSVIRPGFQAKTEPVPCSISKREQKRRLKKVRETTKSRDWFKMKAPEMTEEKKNDLLVIKYRDALDPKRFYKRSDMKGLPKFYQTGTVISHPADFYSARLTKKQRKGTIVDELLADQQLKETNKRRFREVMDRRLAKKGQRAHRHRKRVNKSKK